MNSGEKEMPPKSKKALQAITGKAAVCWGLGEPLRIDEIQVDPPGPSEVPVLSNTVGGILVGLVAAHARGVRKGFVIVSVLPVTALLQFVSDCKPSSLFCVLALPLVGSSVSIYQRYPYKV